MKPPREKKVLSREKQEHLQEIIAIAGSLTKFFKFTKKYKDPSDKAYQYQNNNEISADVVADINVFKILKQVDKIFDLEIVVKNCEKW